MTAKRDPHHTAGNCRACEHPLDRVNRVGLERYIYRAAPGEYRDLAIPDGDGHGGPGIAAETHVTCGHCGAELDADQRENFYRRWGHALDTAADLARPRGHR